MPTSEATVSDSATAYVCAPTQTLQVPWSEDRVDNNWITG